MSGVTTAVIGGGISGLSACWELVRTAPSGTRVVLLESDLTLGGKLRTGELGGRPVDLGPDAFLSRRPEAVDLCREIGLSSDLVAPGTGRAFVWAREMLRPLPAGLALGVPTRLGELARTGICSPAGLGRAATDLLRTPLSSRSDGQLATADDSIGAIVRRRLGNEVHDKLADPLIGGIHAGPVDLMSAAAVFPRLLEANSHAGSLMRALRSDVRGAAQRDGHDQHDGADAPIFLTVRGGLGHLVARLESSLRDKGVEIRTGTEVSALTRSAGPLDAHRPWALSTSSGPLEADGVLLAVPAGAASGLVRTVDPMCADVLDEIPYASVTLVTMRFARDATKEPFDGSGFLVPVSGGGLVTACTWLTSKWPELARPDDFLLRVSMGRFGDVRSLEMTESKLVARATGELSQMFDLRGDPLESVVTRWPNSFPQYRVGHLDRVARVEDRAAFHRGLAVAGAALHGVGIPACVGSGRRAARVLLESLSASTRTPR